MKTNFLLIAMILLSLGSLSCGSGIAADDNRVAVFETSYGRIVIDFFPQDAPKHVVHFKELVAQGFYDGTKFHRIVKGPSSPIAIQGGDPNSINGDPATWGMGQPGQETVPAEFSQTLKHARGIVSAARKTGDENSATSQFFICASPEPRWDGQYSIFGKVIEGMSIVDSIAGAPVWPNGDKPMDPVVLKKAYLIERDQLK